MRQALIDCCEFNWSRISPAVFGSLFQSIMAGDSGKKKRRQIGAHYTSERDIMKLVRSLFLDDLKDELDAATTRPRLLAFHDKLASLRFLDPACGCGNFLVITYRELRLLELEVLKRLHLRDAKSGKDKELQTVLNIDQFLKLNVDQMHGIEIEEWPARIAEVAMWLIDHQMNQLVGETFGQPVLRLPLKKSAKIHIGNALRTDWNSVLPASQCSFVLGNPPFVGAKWQSDSQRDDMAAVFAGVKNAGLLDFVAAWYLRASQYIRHKTARCAFVSTNSICQGEQVGVLWPELLRSGVSIQFAHRTFEWMSEARGGAHVHVVIVGFGNDSPTRKTLYDYDVDSAHPTAHNVTAISPYLVEGPDVVVVSRSTPLCDVPEMVSGNKPIDDGNYLFTPEERAEFLEIEPRADEYFRLWLGGEEFLNGIERWYLHLADCPPDQIRAMPAVLDRVDRVRKFRLASRSAPTRALAKTPTCFHTTFSPQAPFLALPQVSSERREIIPIAYLSARFLPGDKLRCIADAQLYHFGVLTSTMHMGWMRRVCGRLESRYQYSSKLVYNNFPWPSPTDKQKADVEACAQAVLDARIACGYRPEGGGGQTLADLYDPLAMPKALRDAHKDLDRAVDKCYRSAPFTSERQRVEYLFDLYQKLVAPLTPPPGKSRRKPTKPA